MYGLAVRNRVLIYLEALDVAAEGAVWYAGRIGGGELTALHVAGPNTDTGIPARWFDFTGGLHKLDVRPAGTDTTKAVLGEIARLRAEADGIVTVVLPEQFSKRSLIAAAQRAQFRLKLRLLVEPGVVVADVPAVTSERRPEGRVPDRLIVRVLAGDLDDTTRGAVAYARQLEGIDELRAVHFGERSWEESDLGIPVDDEPEQARLGDAILEAVRKLTADPSAAVNVVLPERIQPGLKRLRGRRAIAVKRCLLFEPHVILTSVPHQGDQA